VKEFVTSQTAVNQWYVFSASAAWNVLNYALYMLMLIFFQVQLLSLF